MAFIELKAPEKKLRTLQKRRMKQLSASGFSRYVVDNTAIIQDIIDEIRGGAK
nr:hypothetical protein [Megasphaera vaginalis (ex Srinivasan et al. 2021)]